MSEMSEEVLRRTSLKTINIYQFESTIESTLYKVIETIKNWKRKNDFYFHFDVTSSVSIQNEKVYDSVAIRGYVKNELHNRHTLSNTLYLFFEYLMRECELFSIKWIFDGEMYDVCKL